MDTSDACAAIPRSGIVAPLPFCPIEQRSARHRGRKRESGEGTDRRCDIFKSAVHKLIPVYPITSDQDGDTGEGVTSHRFSCRCHHRLCVPVICGNHECCTGPRAYRRCDPSQSVVYRFTGTDRGAEVTRVANHVWVCKVGKDERLAPLCERRNHRIRNLRCSHLWCAIVRCYGEARDQHASFTRESRFMSTIEEVRHMRVLLRLRHMELPQTRVSNR